MLLPTVSRISSGPDCAQIEPRTATAINAEAPNFETVRLEIMFTCGIRGLRAYGGRLLERSSLFREFLLPGPGAAEGVEEAERQQCVPRAALWAATASVLHR